jgi:hypothetical protein
VKAMKRCLDCGRELPNNYHICKYCDSRRLEDVTPNKTAVASIRTTPASLKANYPHLYTFISFMRLSPDGDGGYDSADASMYVLHYGQEYARLTLKEAEAISPNIKSYYSEIDDLANGFNLGEDWLSEQIRKLRISL